MMNVLNDLIASLPHGDVPVRRVCSGAFWTTVTSCHTGLSTTYRETDQQHTDVPSMVKDAGSLDGKSADELARYAFSENTVAASIGMAALNSALDMDEARCEELNASAIAAEKGAGRNVAVIGHFPFVKMLRPLVKNLWVIERSNQPDVLPESDAERILPQCDVVCMTGTTLINHSFDRMMNLCPKAYVILTGPTSPLSPVLFDYGVDVISGCRVTDAELVNHFITQGATFRQLKHQGVRLYSMRKEIRTS